MRLRSVFVRFYKSFNYDYVRKIDKEVDRKPWEFINDQFYPYVQVSIDPKITAIVGANESGKSHLLSAIEKGITGASTSGGRRSTIERKDFCRYSHFFRSTAGSPRLPDFGFEWTDLSDKEMQEICSECGIPQRSDLSSVHMFRREAGIHIYLPNQSEHGYSEHTLPSTTKIALPHVFRIESDIALPDKVSIRQLINGRLEQEQASDATDREYAYTLLNSASELLRALDMVPAPQPPQAPTISNEACAQLTSLRDKLQPIRHTLKEDEKRRRAAEYNLAYDLIVKIANIDVDDIKLLYSALEKSETGIVRSIVDNINMALARKLNFPRVWAQDTDFALRVEALDFELSFVISDRTGRQYSFDERSSGLKHFLSYYVQYLAHKPEGRTEILLMDEPDAFLSGEAQQDLLKVFQMFADPISSGREGLVPVQVIYVTHSPFLIDKNHSERVRAVEKAEGSKGTRVINGAAQNHYEPLRSAFGAFVGETAFISHCNLFVEGQGDQILLAGTASYLRKLLDIPESEMLDLNQITIVPSGGTSNVPYMVYLARGRDAEKPAAIVLLDSDKAGNEAKIALGKDGPHPRKKQVLDSKFILQLGEISRKEIGLTTTPDNENERPFTEIEDLVPLHISIRAAISFAKTVYGLSDGELTGISETSITARLKEGISPFMAINQILSEIGNGAEIHMDKIPFARTVVDLLPLMSHERQTNGPASVPGLEEFEANMRAVFRRLRTLQIIAVQDVKDKRMRQKVSDKVSTFLGDHPTAHSATRDDAARLLIDIESDLEGDETERAFVLREAMRLRSDHSLTEDLTEPIRMYEDFCESLQRLQHIRELAFETLKTDVAPRRDTPTTKAVDASSEVSSNGSTPEKSVGSEPTESDDKKTKPKHLASPTNGAPATESVKPTLALVPGQPSDKPAETGKSSEE
jgi:predicted ATPase